MHQLDAHYSVLLTADPGTTHHHGTSRALISRPIRRRPPVATAGSARRSMIGPGDRAAVWHAGGTYRPELGTFAPLLADHMPYMLSLAVTNGGWRAAGQQSESSK